MSLRDLSNRISNALGRMNGCTLLDDSIVDEMLKEIGNALISEDVNVSLVFALREKIKNSVKLSEMPAGINKRKMIRRVVFSELVGLLDPQKKPFVPRKNRPNVLMLVGLQGAGKTTTASKLAHHYKKKGWNPCMVGADTFRAGAIDQLKQNALRTKVPFYGSYFETDPVVVASKGVEHFKQEAHDIIIVDTSGRNKQEEELFSEMALVAESIRPDEIMFVLDSTIGQAARDQAKAFTDAVDIGSVIITKLDGHAKGGGAISAVAATECPITFIGNGEYMGDLEEFEPKGFVSKLLGMGDVPGMVRAFEEILPSERERGGRLLDGKFSLRDMKEQMQSLLRMGPVEKLIDFLPGRNNLPSQLKGADGNAKLKGMISILDSLTESELDLEKPSLILKQQSRVDRIARGSGRSFKEVHELIEHHKQFSQVFDIYRKSQRGRVRKGKNMGNFLPNIEKQLTQFHKLYNSGNQ